jgi:putative transposase
MNDSSEIYYVVLRGSGRQPIFQDDEDRHHFTRAVAEAVKACQVVTHAYCWLPTEGRLAVQLAGGSVSQFAQLIADYHTPRLTRETSLTGAHFEQKYRGIPVDGKTELPQLVRHIHLAPLRAGLVDDLRDYRWSSHLAYIGVTSVPWLTTADTLRHFQQPGADARDRYMHFMIQGLERLDLLELAERAQEPEANVQIVCKK